MKCMLAEINEHTLIIYDEMKCSEGTAYSI